MVELPEIDQADFDAWLESESGKDIFMQAVDVFETEGIGQKSADYLVSALRLAFRKGFECGRIDGCLNPRPEIPF